MPWDLWLRFAVALSQQQKNLIGIGGSKTGMELASRALTLQPRLAVEESASQMFQEKLPSNQPLLKGQQPWRGSQWWCFPSLAWHGSIFSLLFGTSCRRLQQTIPCCSFGGFMTVNHFPLFRIFWVYGGVFCANLSPLPPSHPV